MRKLSTGFGFGYIAFWVGMAAAKIGEIPTTSTEVYSWSLPVCMFFALGIPFALGFISGVDA